MKKQHICIYFCLVVLFNYSTSLYGSLEQNSIDALQEINNLDKVDPLPNPVVEQLINSLTTVIGESAGAELDADQIATLLIAIIEAMLEIAAQEHSATCPSALIRSKHEEVANKEPFKEALCAEAAFIAGNIATIIATRKNPLVLGQSIAGIFSGIARLIIQVVGKKYPQSAVNS